MRTLPPLVASAAAAFARSMALPPPTATRQPGRSAAMASQTRLTSVNVGSAARNAQTPTGRTGSRAART